MNAQLVEKRPFAATLRQVLGKKKHGKGIFTGFQA
jgi:hypothetical protein